MDANLLANLDKMHTTELGVVRIKKNLDLADTDIIAWCKDKIRTASNITKQGKNWYVHTDNAVITVNASSFTIITAHKAKK
ncbi:MAG: DUF3781 domain-containing protein [Oscillospiraceae bacterium]|nr:DUF3781 domain-containing protein [Oscillospiraceae bacterium]